MGSLRGFQVPSKQWNHLFSPSISNKMTECVTFWSRFSYQMPDPGTKSYQMGVFNLCQIRVFGNHWAKTFGSVKIKQKSLPKPELTSQTKSRCSLRWPAFHYAISSHTYPCISNPHLWIMHLVGLCRVSSHAMFVGTEDRKKRKI